MEMKIRFNNKPKRTFDMWNDVVWSYSRSLL